MTTAAEQHARDFEFMSDMSRHGRALRNAVAAALTCGWTEEAVREIIERGIADITDVDNQAAFAHRMQERAARLAAAGLYADDTPLPPPAYLPHAA